MGAMSEDVPQLLSQMHNRVRRGLQHETVLADLPVGKNAKGDAQQRFEVVADAIIRRAVTESVDSGILLSEESGEVRFGEHPPIYRFIVDPVDGSDNWGRGLPLSAVSIAVLPVDGPLQPDRVSWAMMGELRGEAPCPSPQVVATGRTAGPIASVCLACEPSGRRFCRVSSTTSTRRRL